MSRALARNDRFDLSYDDDRAMGMGGNDTLHGNDGDNTLTGGSGAGRDILTGGRSADVFIFLNPGHAGDTYRPADRINLRVIDADRTHGGNDAFVFSEGGRFVADKSGQLIVRQAGNALSGGGETRVLMDVDAEGEFDAIIRLSGLHDLGADHSSL